MEVISFRDLLVSSANPVVTSMLLLLSWIAVSDGEASEAELATLRSIGDESKCGSPLNSLVSLARQGDVRDLQLACEVLREVPITHRRPMLQMAIGIALEDRLLKTGEGHILRLLADVLGVDLNSAFVEMTGHEFPEAADPSSVAWWEQSARQGQAKRDGGVPRPGGPSLDRLRDLAILGLDESATDADVRAAYRRMAKIHHPDRFASLGREAVDAANVTFRRIQAAYERLTT